MPRSNGIGSATIQSSEQFARSLRRDTKKRGHGGRLQVGIGQEQAC